MKECISVDQVIDILSRPWMSVEDLGRMTCLGRSKAYELKKNILDDIKSRNQKVLSSSYIPTESFILYMNQESLTSIYKKIWECD